MPDLSKAAERETFSVLHLGQPPQVALRLTETEANALLHAGRYASAAFIAVVGDPLPVLNGSIRKLAGALWWAQVEADFARLDAQH